ncbi:MAG: zf-HC2 domain-containing protein [Acidobacteriota bacterium]
MNCGNARELFADYLAGEVSPEDKQVFAAHMAECAGCRRELEDLNETWLRLGVLAEEKPGPTVSRRFYAMLEDETAKRRERARSEPSAWLQRLFPAWGLTTPRLRLASVVLMAVGVAAGYLIRPGSGREVVQLRHDVSGMRELLAVSLLDRPSAGDRLQGISYSMLLEHTDPRTVRKLLDIVDTDPSVNVRLAAIDALYLFDNEAGVSERLVQSLRTQSSPMVQVALVDLLASWKEARAARALEQLIAEGKLHPAAAARAKANLGVGL